MNETTQELKDRMSGRRAFLHGAAAGVTRLFDVPRAEAEPPPQTTRISLGAVPSIRLSPQYVAEDRVRAEGVHRYPVSAGEWRRPRFYAPAPARGGDDRGGPQQIIAQGTDWRIMNQLKKEPKG